MTNIKTLAFQRLTMNYPQAAIELLRAAGSIDELYDNRSDVRQIMPEATDTFCSIFNIDWSECLRWAEQELAWCEQKHIRYLHPAMPDYPQRLNDCIDAPVGLFYLGNADLNSPHVISIVGTRQSTPYGHNMVARLIADMKKAVPDLLVVSGLAYGIDVCAHRESLKAGADTVGVLAHGLDTMYPASHRNTAVEMIKQGGLLTEYPSHTRGDRQNFLRRNRIVAGMSDCTIVAESKSHGGSLVTARIANDYSREVFAYPGRVGDTVSEGCNDLIRMNKAQLLTCAQDIMDALGWQSIYEKEDMKKTGIQTNLFLDLSPEKQKIVDVLRKGDQQLNVIAMESGIHVGRVTAQLFELEMQGLVKAYAGGTYHLMV